MRVFDERGTGGVSTLQSGRAGQCLQWLVVAGGTCLQVRAAGGCCLKPPNKILRFSCHAAFLHSSTETLPASSPTISLAADRYPDILNTVLSSMTLHIADSWDKMWLWEEPADNEAVKITKPRNVRGERWERDWGRRLEWLEWWETGDRRMVRMQWIDELRPLTVNHHVTLPSSLQSSFSR